MYNVLNNCMLWNKYISYLLLLFILIILINNDSKHKENRNMSTDNFQTLNI